MQKSPNDLISYVVDENGKLHVFFEEDVTFHYSGNKTEITNNLSVDYSKHKVSATAGNLHINPPYSKELENAVKNKQITDAIKYKTEKFYSKKGRVDYKTIGKMQMFNQRYKACSCK